MAKENGLNEFIQFLDNLKPYVIEEINAEDEKVPQIADNLSPENRKFAEKLLMIQNSKGFIVSGDLTDAERMKINRLCQKYGISKRKAVEHFLTNNKFMAVENIDAQRMISLLDDIKKLFMNYYNDFKALPFNMLSDESRQYLSNKHYDVDIKKQIELIIDKFVPNSANIKVEEIVFEARFSNKQLAALKKLKQLSFRVLKFRDERYNIDKIFSDENKEFLNVIIKNLRDAKLSFDEWIRNDCGATYSRIYKVDPTLAVRHMLMQYIGRFGDPSKFRENDPFLESKIRSVKHNESKYSLKEVLDALGISADVIVKKKTLSKFELKEREEQIKCYLNNLFPTKIIDKPLQPNYEELSDDILFIANRKGFKSVGEYLRSIGFEKLNDRGIDIGKSKILLTENDLVRYNFVSHDEVYNFDIIGKLYQAEMISVETNLNNYIKLLSNERTANGRVDYSKTDNGENKNRKQV